MLNKHRYLKFRDLGYIFYRNIVLFTNGVIFAVVALLYIFGDHQAALFLGLVSILNIILGLAQDIHAWVALEKLQFLTAPRATRVNADGATETVLAEDILKGDKIKLNTGDRVPCDSSIISAESLEINEGLITGESSMLIKQAGELILAGSVITSGSAIVKAATIYSESRIYKMTEGVKKHTLSLSPIQKEVNVMVKYSGYILGLTIIFIIARGYFAHEPFISVVKNIGAMSSLIVPAGLIFAMTLFFAYGAARLFKQQVLLQEMSATEKLGRIKNLCMDKTGTITENFLTVEKMHVPEGASLEEAQKLAAGYVAGANDASQIFLAVKKFITNKYEGEVTGELAFSSWRQYGAVNLKENNQTITVLAGSADIFLPHFKNSRDKQWLEELVAQHSKQGKHVLCLARLADNNSDLPRDLDGSAITLVAAFVFFNNLRQGIKEVVDFFQNRGVSIRIITGDNPETAKAVAEQAGIKNTEAVIIGQEMVAWSDADFISQTGKYSIFARIMPEQKEKIITALKRDGFTAMVGDGANDALAVKNADLGIAMFEGAPATRRLASVVLMNNSFAALPKGVELADTIIINLEVFSSIFLNVSFVGLFFFIFISILGLTIPLTPLNITALDYFVIGIPGILISYWSLRSSEKVRAVKNEPFLKRILPFTVASAIGQALCLALIYWLSPSNIKGAESNVLVLAGFIIIGLVFFIYSLARFRGIISRSQKIQLGALVIVEAILFLAIFKVPLATRFFDLTGPYPPGNYILEMLLAVCLFIFIEPRVIKRLALTEAKD